MCKELSDELKRGEDAAKALAAHLLAMGAGNVEFPVVTDGVIVKVSAAIVAKALEGDRDDRND